jgi:hypothetical protein
MRDEQEWISIGIRNTIGVSRRTWIRKIFVNHGWTRINPARRELVRTTMLIAHFDRGKADQVFPSSPREERVGRGLRRGGDPPLPGPLLHPMEEREFGCGVSRAVFIRVSSVVPTAFLK